MVANGSKPRRTCKSWWYVVVNIDNLFTGRTSIVVAHRLSTIISADRILVFNQGEIIGDGTHEELMKNNDVYRDLYQTYYEFQGRV